MRIRIQPAGAFSLVEIAIALAVVAMCLTAILGLLGVGAGANRDSLEQTAAASLSREIYMDISAAASGATTTGTSPRFGFVIPSSGSTPTWPNTLYFSDNGQSTRVGQSPASLSAGVSPRYRASVRLTPPTDSTGPVSARILITWPAMADPNPGNAPANYAGSFEVFAAVGKD